MTKFLLFIIILNFVVVIYNFYMWFTVHKQNKMLENENDDLRFNLDFVIKEYTIQAKELIDIKNKKD